MLLLFAVLAPWTARASPAPPLAHEEVQAWADDTFGRAYEERRFSGLVISVVQDGKVLFAKGYGYADLDRQVPVDPDVTRFRIGSITKTFTAMAVAQLVQDGSIGSFDDPAARYLERAEAPAGTTIAQLATHSAGFGSAVFGLGARDRRNLPLTSSDIAEFRRPVVRAAGDLSVYSNYGISLLGLMVEDVSGQRIDGYMEERIFAPLGMRNTTLNLTSEPSRNLGVPHAFLPGGESQPVGYLGVHPFFGPAGAIETTASDMARYMLANLGEGKGASGQVLSPAGFDTLHRRSAGNHPAASGFGMSFITLDWNGTRFVGHGGDWPGFHSIMFVSPEDNAGFFVSCMCEYPSINLSEQLMGSQRMQGDPVNPVLAPATNVGIGTAFLNRFWGMRTPASTPVNSFTDPALYEGAYWHEYRNFHTAEKVLELFGGPASVMVVERDGETGLRINGQAGYVEISPGVFWNADAEPDISQQFWNSGLWAFTADGSGAVLHASPTFAIDPFVRSSAVANPRFAMTVALVMAAVSLTGLIAIFWPSGKEAERAAKWLPLLIIISLIGIVLSLLEGYPEGEGLAAELLKGERKRFVWMAIFSNAVAAVAALMAWLTVMAWRRKYWGAGARGTARRIHFSMLALAALGLAAVFAFVNLLGLFLP